MKKNTMALCAWTCLSAGSVPFAGDKVWGDFTGNVLQHGNRDNSKWWATTNQNAFPVDSSGGHISQFFRETGTDTQVWSPNPVNVANPGRYLVLRFDLKVVNPIDSIEMSFEYQSEDGPMDGTIRKRWWYATPNQGMQTRIFDLHSPTRWGNSHVPPPPGITNHFAFQQGETDWSPTNPQNLVQFKIRTGWWSSGNDAIELANSLNYCKIDLIAFVDDFSPYVPYGPKAYADFFPGLTQRAVSNSSYNWQFYPSSAPTVELSGDLLIAGDKKENISSLYPRIGLYDNADPLVAEYHVLTAKSAGFAGFNCEWFFPWNLDSQRRPILGSENTSTKAIKILSDKAKGFGFEVGVTWLPGVCFSGIGYSFPTRAEYLTQMHQDVIYIMQQLQAAGRLYPTVNGRLLFPSWELKSAEASTVNDTWLDGPEISGLRSAVVTALGKNPWILAVVRDGHTLDQGIKNVVNGYFSWHTLFLDIVQPSPYPWTHYTTRNSQTLFLQDFYANCRSEWNNGQIDLFMGSLTPRFDSHKALSWGSNTKLGIPDDGGLTLSDTMNTFNPVPEARLVMATTWNDFPEATSIQPTREFGFRDVDIIGAELWSRNGWGPYDSSFVRLSERLLFVRKELEFLAQAGVSKLHADYVSAETECNNAANAISSRLGSATSHLAIAEAKASSLKATLHTHHIDLVWQYTGSETSNGLVREWPTTITPITAYGLTGLQLDGDIFWKIGIKTDNGWQPKLQNHKFVGTLTVEYLDANGTEEISVTGDNNDYPGPDAPYYRSVAQFKKKNAGAWRTVKMDLVNTDFDHALFNYDFHILQGAGGLGGVRRVALEGMSFASGAPH